MTQPETVGDRVAFTNAELRRLDIFRSVDLAKITPLLLNCPVRVLAPGDLLIKAGEPNENLYLLLSGLLGVHIESVTAEPIANLRPGESVGELSLIDHQAASAFVVAHAPSRVLVIDEELMWLLAGTSHGVAGNLLHTLATRLRSGNDTITQDRELLREYRFHATVDTLTGLYNRYWLNKMLPRQMGRSRTSGEPLALVMVDIDHFKRVNDNYGHLTGDRTLCAVAGALRDQLRPADMAARYGGEEFIVVLPGTTLAGARIAAERLRAATPAVRMFGPEGETLPPVTVSVGIAEMDAIRDMEVFIDSCDKALYRAKLGGRDRVSE